MCFSVLLTSYDYQYIHFTTFIKQPIYSVYWTFEDLLREGLAIHVTETVHFGQCLITSEISSSFAEDVIEEF